MAVNTLDRALQRCKERWESSIYTIQRISGQSSLNLSFDMTNENGLEMIERMLVPGFFESIMKDFMAKYIVNGSEGALAREFDKWKAKPTDYIPRMEKQGVSGDRRPVSVDSTAMFPAVWQVLQQTNVWNTNGVISGGVGPMTELMGLRLSQYMPVRGRSSEAQPMNSLFLAVEYGTGVADNVGGAQWVRLEGPTKDHFSGMPGAWWLGRRIGQGVLFTGQKGLHFLRDKDRRMPLPIYLYTMQTYLPGMILRRALGRDE